MNNSLKKLRVVFMGTPDFACPVLEMLINNTDVVMVVCQQSKKRDRKGNIIDPSTKILALNNGIKVFQPDNIKNEYMEIISAKPDIIITCAYGQIIPKELLDYPKYGCINVHGSLLPELRGGAPIHWAIIRGYEKTGITIMYMDSKMDAGDIISQREIIIDRNMILDTLYEEMSYLGRDLLLDTLPSIVNGTNGRVKQDEDKVTYGYNITSDDEYIDFSKSGESIRNLVRGLCYNPGAYCYLDGKRIKIYNVEVLDIKSSGKFGEIVNVTNDSIICSTKDYLIGIKEIKIEGKKRCFVKDYFNGINKKSLVGKVFNYEKE